MKKILLSFLIVCGINSCIDRDTITGTGKQEPDRIIGVGGGLQTGAVGTQLPIPLAIRVLDEKGKPVRNVHVDFIAPKGNASFSDTSVVTDVDGNADTRVILGSKADSVEVNAVLLGVKGSPVIFKLHAVSSGADGISKVSGDWQRRTVGQQLLSPLVINVVDKYGNPVYGLPVYFIVQQGNGSISPNQTVTDSLGNAKAFWTLDTLIGFQTAEARIPVSQASYVTFTSHAVADVPVKIEKLSPDTVYCLQSEILLNALSVRLRDQYNNLDSGVTVNFAVTKGDGAVVPLSQITNVNGAAATTYIAGQFDTLNSIEVSHPQIITKEIFTARVYKYFQIDSLNSSGGSVTLWWQTNLNSDFTSYELQRCGNSSFDSTTVIVTVITDIAVTSATDSTPTIGTSPFYRLKVNFPSGFFFYTNKRDVTVQP